MVIEFDQVDRITADAQGPPGQRTFYLQARKGDRLVTLLVEKQQVQLLAASVVEILARVGKETGEGPTEDEMTLDEPVLPEWRAGRLSIGYHDERDLLLLEVEELPPDTEEDEDEEDDEEEEEADEGGLELASEPAIAGLEELEGNGELGDAEEDQNLPVDDLKSLEDLEGLEVGRDPQVLRVWATREQMLSMARHGAAVCASGRPRCQLCGNAIDPEGHRCPALNGHRPTTQA